MWWGTRVQRQTHVTFQDHAYAWLTDGSLESRTARALRKEGFGYDYLGRLEGDQRIVHELLKDIQGALGN